MNNKNKYTLTFTVPSVSKNFMKKAWLIRFHFLNFNCNFIPTQLQKYQIVGIKDLITIVNRVFGNPRKFS